jgi:hypothetical protein
MNSRTDQPGVPTPSSDFDAIDWINGCFHWGDHLKYDELKPVLGFCLLWSLFENNQCDQRANPQAIRRCVDRAYEKSHPSESQYERCLEFFRRQYFPNGAPSKESLDAFFQNKKEQDMREIVCKAFGEPPPDPKIIVHALLLLTYRVRNNLFHGEKELFSLPRQAELFNQINSFLATLLDEIRLSGSPAA